MNVMILIVAGFIAITMLLILFEKGRQRRIGEEYDEMQLRIRGKAAWYAVYMMIFYMAAYMILEKVLGFSLLTASDAVFLGAIACGSVNAGYTILHDSYYGMNWSRGRNLVFLLIIALAEIWGIAMLVSLARGGAFADISRTIRDERILPVLCLPMFTTILAATLIRHLHREEEDEG